MCLFGGWGVFFDVYKEYSNMICLVDLVLLKIIVNNFFEIIIEKNLIDFKYCFVRGCLCGVLFIYDCFYFILFLLEDIL